MSKNQKEEIYNLYKEYMESLTAEEKEKLFLTSISKALDEASTYEIEAIKKLYKDFKEADKEEKEIIIEFCIIHNIRNASYINSKYNENLCERFGHKYGRWDTYEVSHYGQVWWSHYEQKIIDEAGWEKKCSVCGHIVRTTEEPKSVKEKRLKKEKQDEIRRLEKRLNELKQKNK